MSEQAPTRAARTRVTGPPRRLTPRTPAPASREIDADTRLGEIYVGSLMRDQLRLATRLLLLLCATVATLPLLFFLAPGLADVAIGPVPLPWLLLGVLVHPWLLVIGTAYVRRAESNERAFAAHVRAHDPDSPW